MTSGRQMSLWLFAAVSVFVAAVVPPALAIPLTDVSSTSVDVHAVRTLKSHTPKFVITVNRVDDLLSESGELIVERRVKYDVSFTVAYKGGDSLLMNGVPIQANMDKAKLVMDAQMAIDARKLDELGAAAGTVIRTPEGAQKAAEDVLDVGVVTVDVGVDFSIINVQIAPDLPIVPVRRFVLTENVVEVNGRMAMQTSIGEQVFFVLPDGSFAGLTGEADWTNVSQGAPAPVVREQVSDSAKDVVAEGYADDHACGSSEMSSRMADWLRTHPLSTVLLVSLVAAAFAVIYAGVGAVINRFRKSRMELPTNSEDVAKSYSGEKKMVSSPPRYQALAQERASEDALSKSPGVGENEVDTLCQ